MSTSYTTHIDAALASAKAELAESEKMSALHQQHIASLKSVVENLEKLRSGGKPIRGSAPKTSNVDVASANPNQKLSDLLIEILAADGPLSRSELFTRLKLRRPDASQQSMTVTLSRMKQRKLLSHGNGKWSALGAVLPQAGGVTLKNRDNHTLGDAVVSLLNDSGPMRPKDLYTVLKANGYTTSLNSLTTTLSRMRAKNRLINSDGKWGVATVSNKSGKSAG